MKNRKINKILRKTKIKKDFRFSKKVIDNSFKKRKNCWVAIILKESKDASIFYISNRHDRFSVDGHLYFNSARGKYINTKNIISVYLEGVILPIDHSYIQYETIYNLFVDSNGDYVKSVKELSQKEMATLDTNADGSFIYTDDGHLVSTISEQIKGLEFDSKTTDVLFEGNLTERMAMDGNDRALPLLTVLNFIILGCVIAGIVVTYFLNQ